MVADTRESPMFIVRFVRKVADSIREQAKEPDSPSQRSGSMLSYCISPFAAICMSTAIILNRIMVFASTRSQKKLPLLSKIVLRSIALYLLFRGSYGVLVAFKAYAPENDIINKLIVPSSYFKYNYEEFKELSFLGVSYSPTNSFLDLTNPSKEVLEKGPSPSVLKPLYLSLCLGQIIETFIAVTNGNDPTVENGLTLFEYSLAFQEVQSADVTSYELLIISLVALSNQVIIHLLNLLNLQRYRLIPSTFIGSFALTFYFLSIINGRILYFPFIVIMGYLPQLFTVVVIALCLLIFVLAAIFKGSLRDLTFFKLTHNLSSLNILMDDDFYTALANLGTFVITAAGRARYTKELSDVTLTESTWLENNLSSATILKKLTGYSNKLELPPELANVKSKTSKRKGSIMIKKMRKAVTLWNNFMEVIISICKNSEPKFVRDEKDDHNDDNQEYNHRSLVNKNGNNEGFDFIEEDNSPNYIIQDNNDSDSDLLEYDSGYESDYNNIEQQLPVMTPGESNPPSINIHSAASRQRHLDVIGKRETTNQHTNPLVELINSPDDLLSLFSSNNDDSQLLSGENFRILKAHLTKNEFKPLTRSMFNNNDFEQTNKLIDLIGQHRKVNSETSSDDEAFCKCVICQVNPRQIILWPCKCFAICESCRMSLVVRDFNDCVCCRGKVEGYSKIYIP
ncbi:hypothetical protein PACTADRAFT_1193 [Pachysolen tannophilus NRRL Y-2460]|uniref:RING-type domain-containing protein n=1 Tax=Pachysolen tannophilus NRRL Y-2460 TaxID=669874 RepID=A0A1E4TXU3_PACTA|nr:hypothetical protein PACTADRAFT_1193 [Pachysolen tannophilus NRRL Y-2460]